jgi:DNA-binding NtrC family response regulator
MQNILVVDDDKAILNFIHDALEGQYKVFVAESVTQAEGIIQGNTINLLITDLVMPDKNGIDMIMAMHKQHPDMKILAISGGGGITGRFDYLPIAKLVGAQITLKKPFTISDLRDNVKQLINK